MNLNYNIKIKNVFKTYKNYNVLSDVSLEINSGETLGIIGPNGAGKSTLLSIISSIIKPSKGSVEYICNNQDIKKFISFVPQEIALFHMLTAYENLDFWCGIYSIKKSDRIQRISDVLNIVNLSNVASKVVSTYSGGMKRRLNIAISLLNNPQILIMDEPTVGIDVFSRKLILETIKKFKSLHKTVLFTSHNIDEIEHICDRIAILNKGRLIHLGKKNDILSKMNMTTIEDILFKLETEY